MSKPVNNTPPEQKKRNTRTALILFSTAIVFFVGFMVRMVYFGR